MTALLPPAKRPVPLALALGVLGGGVLVVTAMFAARGQVIFLPYVALLVGSLVAVRLAGWAKFSDRFVAAFLAFMVASGLFYVFVGAVAGSLLVIPFWGHAWRLGLLAIVGGVLSGAVAYLADLGR